MASEVGERIIARLRLEADGSLSNVRVEQYALLRAEEVVAPSAAWTIIMSSARGNLPSSSYQQNVHKSPAFKRRLEALMEEKAHLGDSVWGQLEWQARQTYRKASALNDLRVMQSATDTLLKIALRNEKPEKPEKADDGESPRGRGAPAIPIPLPTDNLPNYRADKLLGR